jgi:hypothetical protein
MTEKKWNSWSNILGIYGWPGQGEFDTFLLLCKESLNTLYSDGQQFSQYQQKRIFTSHFKSFNTKKSWYMTLKI